ncbi:MAG: glycosyltransferase [Oribacterium sp.]|nr:glycosyltransferase [Oribacterium sp.]
MGSLRIKKIAIIIHSICGGGAERTAQTIGNYYLDKGLDVYYFLLSKTNRMAYAIRGRIVKLDITDCCESWSELVHLAMILRKAKKEYGIDVSLSFMEEANFLNVMSRVHDKIVVSVHTTLSKRYDLQGFYYDKSNIRRAYRRADYIVAVSEYVKDDLISNYHIKEKKIKVIPNPAMSHSQKVDEEWRYGEKAIITVGRLEPVKQHDRLIRTFSYVKDRCPESNLVIVGEGRLKRYLEKVCRDYKVEESVYFVGFTNAPEFYEKNARVFVMTSYVEGFPNAIVEAMMQGTPVITTDSPGGCGEIVGKEKSLNIIQYCEYGILTPYIEGRIKKHEFFTLEEKLLGEAIVSVLENEEIYKHYTYKSRLRAEQYSLSNIMNDWNVVLLS